MLPEREMLRAGKGLYFLFGALLLMMLGIGIVATIMIPAHQTLLAVLTLIAAIIFAVPLVMARRTHLLLTKDGFEACEGLKALTVSWQDVGEFSPMSVKRSGYEQQLVVFDFVDGYEKYPRTRMLAKAVTGREGAISCVFGCAAAQLAEKLNAWRARAGDVKSS